MALYRVDIQKKVPCAENVSGFYYWTNVFYFDVDNPTDYDLARDEIVEGGYAIHNQLVMQDRFLVRLWPSGTVVQSQNQGDASCGGMVGDPLGLCNTIYFRLITDGPKFGFKRFRIPLLASEIVANRLTDTAYDYYLHSTGNFWAASSFACLEDGTHILDSVLSPLVHGWQLRHGTKRRAYRRLS